MSTQGNWLGQWAGKWFGAVQKVVVETVTGGGGIAKKAKRFVDSSFDEINRRTLERVSRDSAAKTKAKAKQEADDIAAAIAKANSESIEYSPDQVTLQLLSKQKAAILAPNKLQITKTVEVEDDDTDLRLLLLLAT